MTTCPTTLPASWFTSKAIYGLERRSIFLRSWILLGAISKWPNVGEEYHHEMAQVEFIVRRTSEDWKSIEVVVHKGSEKDTPIRHHKTSTGLLFITLSDATISFEDFFPGLEELTSRIDFTQFPVRRSLKYSGSYNWKTLIDGYQECLHCPFAHPAFAKVYKQPTYKVINNRNYSQHIAESDKPNDGLFLYLFPNSTLNLYGGGMSSFRTCPSDNPSQTTMEFDYYHLSPVGSETFESYYKFARTVGIEDHELCEKAQRNLEAGIYTEGILNPEKENGVAYYQNRVFELCLAEYEKQREEDAKRTTLESIPAQAVDPAAA